jgi:hypothetical protein
MTTASVRTAGRRETLSFDRMTLWGTGLSVAGLLIAAVSLHLRSPGVSPTLTVLLDLAVLVGMTLFALGVLGMLLGSRVWRTYIEAGLREVVLEPSYLETLSPEGRRDHLIDILKTEYGDRNLGLQGRMLRYCLDNVHKYLVHPYREDARIGIDVEVTDATTIKVTETLDYTSRQAGGKTQDRIVWEAPLNEVAAVLDFRIDLRWPRGHPEHGRKMKIGIEDVEIQRLADGSRRFEYALEDLGTFDGLRVRVESVCLAHSSSFHTWRITDPVRGADLEITHPPELDLQFIPYLLDHDSVALQRDKGFACARFDSWILPGSGFAWKLVPKYLPDEVQVGRQGADRPTLDDVIADSSD